MRRRSLGAALALCCLCTTPPAARAVAPDDDALTACMAPVLAPLTARGATQHDATTMFLVEGQLRSSLVVLEAPGCVGFLAVGAARVRDLDLFLHTAGGTLLVEDTGPDAHPYVRFCGAAGLQLAVTVRMYTGQGEARLVRLDDAPATIPDLDALLGECIVPVGGVRRPRPEIGPDVATRTLDASLAAVVARQAELGRAAAGASFRATLVEHSTLTRDLSLVGDACYAVEGVGGHELYNLDLAVAAPDGTAVTRDANRALDAQLAFCTTSTGIYRLSVHADVGHGEVAVQLFRVPAPAAPLPAGLVGGARVRYAELGARMATRGFGLRPLGWGQLGPGERLAMPLPVTRGQCVAVGGVASDDLDGADLDVVVEGDDGRLVAWHVGLSGLPLVYVCAERDERLRIVGKVNGQQLGRYLIVVGEDSP